MPRYQGTDDMRVVAEDVNPVQINPTIGIYQEGHGAALTRFGNTIESMGTQLNLNSLRAQEAALEREKTMAYASALSEDTQGGIQTTFASLIAAGATEDDIRDIIAGQKDASLLREYGIQNPHSVMGELRRAINFNRRILQRPQFAPEFEQAYRVGGGKAIGTGLRESAAAASNPIDALQQTVIQEASALGLNLNNSNINDMYNAVVRNQAAKREYEAATAQLALTGQRLDVDSKLAQESMNRASSADLVITQGDVGRILDKVRQSDTPQSREDAIQELREYLQSKQATYRTTFSNYGISQAAIDSSLGGTIDMINTTIAGLQGKESLEMLQTAVNLTVQGEVSRQLNRPGVKQAVGYGTLARMLPDTWSAELAKNANFGKFLNGITDMAATDSSLDLAFNGTSQMSREEAITFANGNRQFFRNAARSEDITDDQFGTFVNNLYGSYVLGGQAAELFNRSFDTLASDDVVSRLSKVQDATVRSRLQTNVSRYLDDIVKEALVSAESEGGNIELIGVGRALKYDQAKDLVTVTYSTSGVPTFSPNETGARLTTQEGSRELNEAIAKFNRAGTKIGQAVKVLQQGLGLYTDMTPAELAESIVNRKAAPGITGRNPTTAQTPELGTINIDDIIF